MGWVAVAAWSLVAAPLDAGDSGWQAVPGSVVLEPVAALPPAREERPPELPEVRGIRPVAAEEPIVLAPVSTGLPLPAALNASPKPVRLPAEPLNIAVPPVLSAEPPGTPNLAPVPPPLATAANAGPPNPQAKALLGKALVPDLVVQVDLLAAFRGSGPRVDLLQARNKASGGLLDRISAANLNPDAAFGPAVTVASRDGGNTAWEARYFSVGRWRADAALPVPTGVTAVSGSPLSPYQWPLAAGSAVAENVTRWTSLQLGSRNFAENSDERTVSGYSGWRYHYYRDGVAVANGAGGETLGFAANNHLFGPEWGGEWAEHFGPLTLGVRGVGGAFANLIQTRGRFESFAGTGSPAADASLGAARTAFAVAAAGQAGAFARMQWTRDVSLELGGDLHALCGVAQGADQGSTGFVVPGPASLALGKLKYPHGDRIAWFGTLSAALRWEF